MSRNDDIHIRVVDKHVSIAGIEYKLFPTDDWLRSAIIRRSSPHLVELYAWIRSLGGDPQRGLEELDGPPSSTFRTSGLWSRRVKNPQPSSSSPSSTPLTSPTGTKIAPRPVPVNRRRVATTDEVGGRMEEPSLPTFQTLAPTDLAVVPAEDAQGQIEPSAPHSEHQGLQQQQQLTTPDSETTDPKVQDFDHNTILHIATFFKEGLDATGITVFGEMLTPNRRPTSEFISSFFYGVVLSPLLEPALIEAAIHVLQRTLQLHGPEPFTGLWDVSKRRRELLDGKLPIISGFFNQKSTAMSNLFLSHPRAYSETNPPSAASTSSGYDYLNVSSSSNNFGTRTSSSFSTNGGSAATFFDYSTTPRRLPAWNDLWEMIRALLRLDNRPENQRFFDFQEFRIKLVLQPHGEQSSSSEEDEEEEEPEEREEFVDEGDTVSNAKSTSRKRKRYQPTSSKKKRQRQEQYIRDELGRKIVGFLFNVLEQDIVQKNVSKSTFFYKKVMLMDMNSQRSTMARLALDFVFQVMQTATAEPYMKRPMCQKTQRIFASTNSDNNHVEDLHDSNAMDISFTGDDSNVNVNDILRSLDNDDNVNVDNNLIKLWDTMNKCELTPAGQELLDLAQRMLSWLIQYAQSGMFGREQNVDFFARDVAHRLGRLQNRMDAEERRGRQASSNSSVTAVMAEHSSSKTSTARDKITRCRMRIDQSEAIMRAMLYPHAYSLSTITPRTTTTATSVTSTTTHVAGAAMEPSPGLSTFTMITMDLLFRLSGSTASLSSARAPGSLPVFKHVVDYYAMPPDLPESITHSTRSAVTAGATTVDDAATTTTRKTRSSRQGKKAAVTAAATASSAKANDKAIDEILLTLEVLEWLVMKLEILVGAWIQAVGIQREDLARMGPGFQTLLSTMPMLSSSESTTQPATDTVDNTTSTGWTVMSRTLETIGGTLWARWQNLEQAMALAAMTEDWGMV